MTTAEHPLLLRIKSKEGNAKVDGLTSHSTLGHLLDKIQELTKIPSSSLKLLHGFPPCHVDTSNPKSKLSDFSLRTGDTIIVEENKIAGEGLSKAEVSTRGGVNPGRRGILTRRVVPADNSCLFRSIALLMEGGETDGSRITELRNLIASVVCSRPAEYTDAVLGKSNTEYCLWIRNSETWGGAIEISILAEFYEVEINVVDTQSLRVDKFGENRGFRHCIYLIYDNIHYDPLVLESADENSSVETVFPVGDDWIFAQAMELAQEAKRSRQYTDLTGFTLRCLVCQLGLRGQRQAQQHAMATGHKNFVEYSNTK